MGKNRGSLSIKKWNEDDRPREKLLAKGASELTNSELLAILIGSGNQEETAVALSQRMLASANNKVNTLGKWSVRELMVFKGIGEAKAIGITAAMELGKRRTTEKGSSKIKISSSEAVYAVLQPIIGELTHEEFWIVYLDNSNNVLQKKQLSKGGITGTLVDSRIVFKNALLLGAVAIILAHNHPSGSLKPSQADIQLTQKLTKAGNQLDVKVLDHVIITEDAYFSFADEALL